MNETIKQLWERKSVREYTNQPITNEEKEMILQAALQAPTAGNMALYSIIDIQDQKLKDELAIRCDHQPFIAKAPLVLIFLADYQKWFDIFQHYTSEEVKIEESDLLLACEDCMIAAQNAVVAAQSLGIGSCYIGDILENFEANQELLHLPQYAIPLCMVVFGKPTPSQINRKKPTRFALEDMVSVDYYREKTTEETIQMFEKQTGKSGENLEKYIRAFAKRKFYALFREEMNRSSRAIIQHWIK